MTKQEMDVILQKSEDYYSLNAENMQIDDEPFFNGEIAIKKDVIEIYDQNRVLKRCLNIKDMNFVRKDPFLFTYCGGIITFEIPERSIETH